MVARQDARSLVKGTFPGYDSLIDRAYRENALFHDLCQDYRNCTLALQRWRVLNGERSSERAQEYVELLAELTHEVELWLGALQDGTAPQPWDGTP